MNRQDKTQLIITADGSHTLYMKEMDETYHSIHGAIAESMHIYIQSGLDYIIKKDKLNILEVGLGTGLNALLTYKMAQTYGLHMDYVAIEPYPLDKDIYEQLNYSELLSIDKGVFLKLHAAKHDCSCNLGSFINFNKKVETIEETTLALNHFDLIYFDLFNPALNLEIWGLPIFQKLFCASKQGAVLVTYSTKGVIRRAMEEAGFIVEKIPGPTGKREITRAKKNFL